MVSNFDSLPELSPDIKLEYLAEGGANIVYRIILPIAEEHVLRLQPSEIPHYGSSTPPPTEIDDIDINPITDIDADTNITSGKLLRLRKNVRYGLPYRDTAHDFQTKIRPLFSDEELVDQTMVRVPASVIQRCNAKLQERERLGKRPSIRCSVYLAEDEPLGMLVTDMTTTTTTTTTTTHSASNIAEVGNVVELKPKWLVQSPSAPAKARRCRTCALRDMKRADLPSDSRKATAPVVVPPGKAQFCPLDLTSNDKKDMQRTIRHIFPTLLPEKIDIIASALYQHPILQKLLSLQRIHNNVGLNGPSSGSKETSLSMTLRDCSCFLKVFIPPPWILNSIGI
jgi:inositol-pentakisphosphate 2-kinase